MPTYDVTDPRTGKKVSLTGDSPPTEQELEEIFAKLPQQGIGGAFTGGFMGQERETGYTNPRNIAEEVGQIAGPLVGGIVGAPGGPLGIGLGAAAGRAAQTAIQAGGGRDVSIPSAIGEPVLEGALNLAGAKYAPVTAQAAVNVAGPALKTAASTFSGVASDLIERAVKRPLQVLAQRGEEAVPVAADALRQGMQSILGTASTMYDDVIQKVLSGGKYGEGWRFPLSDSLQDTFAKVSKEFGFGQPNRFGPAAGEQEIFNSIVNRAIDIGQASAEQVYYFQRDLNAKIAQHVKTPLGAALRDVRDKLRSELGTSVPEIGEANKIYARLKPLEDLAEKFADRQNIASFVRQAAKDKSLRTAGELEAIAQEFPVVAQGLETLNDAIAGSALSPGLPPSLVRTGLTGSLVYGLGAVNPAVYATLPFYSPRLVGLGAAYAHRAAQGITGAAASRTGRVIGGQFAADAIRDEYIRRRTRP